jgi:hypothetical protein
MVNRYLSKHKHFVPSVPQNNVDGSFKEAPTMKLKGEVIQYPSHWTSLHGQPQASG